MSKAGTHNRHFGRKYSRFGEDGYGQEVTAYGNTTGKSFQWDYENDKAVINGAVEITGNITQTGNQAVTGGITASGGVTVTKSTTNAAGLPAVGAGAFRLFMTSTKGIVAKTSTGTITLS